MEKRLKLLRILADGRFRSGEMLAAELGISRAGVWKHLQAIKAELDISLDAVSGKGYRLREPLELLSAPGIQERLGAHTRTSISELHIHHSIDSTNSWLMHRAAVAAPSGTVCLAERQTAGKGRHGRIWVSPFGRNIYLSLLWRFELAPNQLSGLSLAAGIALMRVLRQFGCHEVGLKWPNDLLWHGRKLAGLLLEVAGEATGPAHVVIGLGLNFRMGKEAAEINQPWVDLASIPYLQDCSRNALVAALLDQLVDVIQSYETAGLQGFIEEWHRYDLLKGKEVEVRSPQRIYQGEHLGIDEAGGLRLKVDGVPRTFYAGEVSLRGLAE